MYEIKEDSIQKWAMEAEKIFASNHEKAMTDSQVSYLITCQRAEDQMEKDKELIHKLEKNEFGYCSVFYNRVKYCHTFECTIAVCVFMGIIATSFGDVTIFSNFLQYKAFKHNQRKIDMNFICVYCFPWGFPTKEALKMTWDLQKVERQEDGPDNLLDYGICQKSISFADENKR